MTQANAYGLIGECTFLMSSSNTEAIRAFISSTQELLPEIKKYDAIITVISAAVTDRTQVASLGIPLNICLQDLQSHLRRVDRG